MLIVATKYLFAKNVHLIIWRLNYSKVFKIFFSPTIKYSFANNIDVLLLARPFKYLSAGRAPSRPPLGRAPSWFEQPLNISTNIFLRYLKYSFLIIISKTIILKTRSSWLNCALRDDEAVYWVI